MVEIKMAQSEFVFLLVIINVILGILFGLFPLISGFALKNRKYGFFGFIISIIGGAILGVLLSFPIAFVFTWLILKKPSVEEVADSDVPAAVNENPLETSTEDSKNL